MYRNARMSRLLAAEQRLAWARTIACDDLRAVTPLQVRDGVLMYTQMLGMATVDQFQTLKQMRSRREAAPYAPPTMTAKEKKALREAPARDEILAKLVVPDRDALRRFCEAHWSFPGGADDTKQVGWPRRMDTPLRPSRYDVELARRLAVHCARPGYVTCSLMWDAPGQSWPHRPGHKTPANKTNHSSMSLCCAVPGGAEISRHSTSLSQARGRLDVSELGDHPVEHIIFPHRPLTPGKYKFWVIAGSSHGKKEGSKVERSTYTVRTVCGAHVVSRRLSAHGDTHPCWEFEVGRNGEVMMGSIAMPSSTTGAGPAVPACAGRDDERQQYLCLHASRPISAYHVLSQHAYSYTVNPNVGWHVEQSPGLQVQPSTAVDMDLDKRLRDEMRRKTERDQLEIQKVQQSIRWFEYQLKLGQDENDSEVPESVFPDQSSVASRPWRTDDPEREQKLRRGRDIMVQKLPKHLAEKLNTAGPDAVIDTAVANLRNDTGDQSSRPSHFTHDGADSDAQQREWLAPRQSAAETHPENTQNSVLQVDQSSVEPSSTLHWREERFAAIERRLASTRAAKRLDMAATRRQADDQLQSRINQFDSDRSLVDDWEHRYKRTIAWSRMEARHRRFEADVHRHSSS